MFILAPGYIGMDGWGGPLKASPLMMSALRPQTTRQYESEMAAFHSERSYKALGRNKLGVHNITTAERTENKTRANTYI